MDDLGFCEQSVQVLRKEEGKKRGLEPDKTESIESNTAAKSSLSSVMILQILKTVCQKLVRNPNSYASLIGLSWALVSCRYTEELVVSTSFLKVVKLDYFFDFFNDLSSSLPPPSLLYLFNWPDME